ncbi:MAG: [protein-PII] uridylyltransferase [Proteobacteria bacterium]|nr:[protein-PII] uridylyltransferase [Pseudomonadota bacterium]
MPELNGDYLKKKKEALISSFIQSKGTDFPEKLAHILDEYLCQCFEKSPTGLNLGIVNNPYSIIALGSYGRKEPCIRSDIALLFLFQKTLPDEAEQLIKEFVYPLWDSGFEVTQVVRTLDECIEGAEKDVDVLVSLLDGRFICGMSRLFFQLNEDLREKIVTRHSSDILTDIVEKNKGRHDRFGDSSYLLEPNLKEGKGGLADYDAMLSMARIKSGLREPRDMEYGGYLSEKEFEDVRNALSFVLKIRNVLHHLTGRKCDQLFMEYQPRIADLLYYKKKDGQEPVECFMGDLHSQMRIIKQQYKIFLSELGYFGNRTPTGRITTKKTRVRGLSVNEKNMLIFASPESLLQSPELLVKLFAESASLKIPPSAEARRIVRDLSPKLVTPAYRKSRSVVRAFEKVLLTPAHDFNVLDEMVRTGFMECMIPEFKGIMNRIQYNEYHLFPVDKHSLMTVRVAKLFGIPGKTDSLCKQIYSELPDKKILLWACLLHDIGKSDLDGMHSEKGALLAENILLNLGYSSAIASMVGFLVREHLFLVKMATRRDVHDEETAVFCAKRIKDEHCLALLYLLTVADSMSTGPKAWNDWTHSLLQSLYHRTLTILKKEEFAPDEAVETIERKKDMLARIFTDKGMDESRFQKFFSLLSLRYLLTVPVMDIVAHAHLFESLGSSPFVWEITGQGTQNARTLTISAKNRPGLFSKIAGVLTLCGFNILDAQIYTWKNNTGLDVFHLAPPLDLLFEEEKWAQAKEELSHVLVHEVNLKVRLDDMIRHAKPAKRFALKQDLRIDVDNETSGYFTIIDVHTDDYPGLLFSITDTLFKCGLDIYVSKIATNMDQVVDIFYVRNLYGEKVHTPEQIAMIKGEITRVLKQNET